MDIKSLLQRIESQYQSKLPFVLFSLPNEKLITTYFQKNQELYPNDLLEKGVRFAPFNSKESILCMSTANSEVIETKFTGIASEFIEISIQEDEKECLRYKELVGKAIESIEDRLASKIVISRRKKLALKEVNLTQIITRLLNFFPDAFNYVWYHPKTGIWVGATPELLLNTNGIAFTTMALAGTQKVKGNLKPEWTTKEINEQQYVTDAITLSLEKLVSVLKISKTYTHKAGSIVHLRTDISGALKNGKATLDTLASSLHPTPAVCGTPRLYSKAFIENNENYDREFYTGYIGPVDKEMRRSQLYVNLRCMKIEENMANLFVGGGITSTSNPDHEWEETQNKLQTMLQVLKPFLN